MRYMAYLLDTVQQSGPRVKEFKDLFNIGRYQSVHSAILKLAKHRPGKNLPLRCPSVVMELVAILNASAEYSH